MLPTPDSDSSLFKLSVLSRKPHVVPDVFQPNHHPVKPENSYKGREVTAYAPCPIGVWSDKSQANKGGESKGWK